MRYPEMRIRFFLFLTLILIHFGCHGNRNPLIDKSFETDLNIKDGVIDILIKESGQLNDTTFFFNTIDTLHISEHENALEIKALPFSFPHSRGYSFYFFGNFRDMDNAVCVWFEFFVRDEKKMESDFLYIRNNQGIHILIPDHHWSKVNPEKRLQAFAFALDTDSVHSGTGKIIVKADAFADTIYINAAWNTADYSKVASVKEFSFSEMADNTSINGYKDAESYLHLKHNAIWLLFNQGESSVRSCGTAHTGVGFSFEYDPCRDFVLYGFAPVFITNLEEP